LLHYQLVNLYVTLTATSGDNHIGGGQEIGVMGNSGVIQGQTGGVSAKVLPPSHLALIAAFGDLSRYVKIDNRMNQVGSLILGIDSRHGHFARSQLRPVGFKTFAQRAEQPDPGDPNL
jgi:hypothetical protein